MGKRDSKEQEINREQDARVSRHVIDLAQQGDTEAIGRIIETYYKDMLYYATKQVGLQNGQDVTQRAIEQIISQLGNVKDKDKLKSWLMRVVHNECLDFVRAQKRQATHMQVVEFYDETQRDLLEERSQAFERPFTTSSDEEIENEVLISILDEMPNHFSSSIRLRYLDQMSYAEIAETRGVSVSKVKNDLHRGMKLLQERVRKSGGKEKLYAAKPAVVASALTAALQADQNQLITPQALEAGLSGFHDYLATLGSTGVGIATATTAASAASGTATVAGGLSIKAMVAASLATVTATTGIVLAVTQPPAEQEESIPEPLPQAQPAEPTPPAEPEPEPVAEEVTPINSVTDMIGAEEAARLEQYQAEGVDSATWEAFMNELGADLEMVSQEPKNSYSTYLLVKQDKQLLFASRESADDQGFLQIRTQFGPIEDIPNQMGVINMFG